MTSLELAYLAGFIDGEGYIGLTKRIRKNWSPEYHISIAIGQKDGATLSWIKDNFKGTLHQVKRDKSYMWLSSNEAAYKILKAVYPYLRYKKPQAEIAITFQEEMLEKSKGRNKKMGIPANELARREELLIEMKRLKHVFSGAISLLS